MTAWGALSSKRGACRSDTGAAALTHTFSYRAQRPHRGPGGKPFDCVLREKHVRGDTALSKATPPLGKPGLASWCCRSPALSR